MGITRILLERMELANYDKYEREIALAYSARPDKEPNVSLLQSWKVLKDHNHKMFPKIESKVEVIFTDQYDDVAYNSAEEMKERVLREKKIYIDTNHSEHQVWNEKDNWVFRAVHDFIVHIGGNHSFGQRGEIGAYNRHAKIVPPKALPALFSEVVGQVCFTLSTGDFPDPQKASIIYGADYRKVGRINYNEYYKNFWEGIKKPLKVNTSGALSFKSIEVGEDKQIIKKKIDEMREVNKSKMTCWFI